MAHQSVLSAADLCSYGVEPHSGLLVVQQTVGHGLAGAELVSSHEHGDVRAVLCQEGSFFSGRVAAADNVQRLVAEDGDSAVAHCARGHAVLPVLVLAGEVHPARGGAGGDDDGVGGVCLVRGELGGVLEGAGGEVQRVDGVGDDGGAAALGLLAQVVHQSAAHDAVWEAGEVLDVGGRGELAAGGDAVRHEPFVQHWFELGSGGVDGGCVGGWPRADDDDFAVHGSFCRGGGGSRR